MLDLIVRINFFSDIHLEFGEIEDPSTDADVIIAAGDIGIYTEGVEWLKTLPQKVLYVAGNHEFYSNEYNQTISAIRHACRDSQVVFLEKDELIIDDVRFLGCTLWADLYCKGEDKALLLSETLNDFKRIMFGDHPLDAQIFTELHRTSKHWLVSELEKPFAGKTVVITHHAPTEWSWRDSPSALKKLAYCNDLKELFHEFDISAWFHGHVHSVGDYRLAGARILSNPRGYYGRRLVEQFKLNKTIEI